MTAQARIFRFIHHSHATAAELTQDAIVGDRLADHGEVSLLSAVMLGPGQGQVNPERRRPPFPPYHRPVLHVSRY